MPIPAATQPPLTPVMAQRAADSDTMQDRPAAALGVQGSGWAGLFWDSIGQNLLIQQFFDQQGQIVAGTVPLLLLDVWEHAYYLDYKNVRADYVKAFWNIANWADAQERFAAAREKTTGLLVLS